MPSVTLIGMPGAGKSTVGVLLAKLLGLDFVDTDLLIQVQESRTLQQIVDSDGHQHLRAVEEAVILETEFSGKVIATGGSAVYSSAAMQHLATFGPVVFIDVPYEVLLERLGDYAERGIAMSPQQTLEALYEERNALYKDRMTFAVDGSLATQAVARQIAAHLNDRD